MRPIPPKIREQLANDPRMRLCIYEWPQAPNHNCRGRITFEHAIIYAGKQIVEAWATVPCCENHNSGPEMVKEYNVWAALQNITTEELEQRYPRRDWRQLKKYLNQKYE